MDTTAVGTPETGHNGTGRDAGRDGDPGRVETVADLAAALGVAAPTFRKWAGRRGLLPPPTPGRPTLLPPALADELRRRWLTRDSRPGTTAPRPETAGTGRDKTPETRPDPDAGWRDLVAELRADRDRLRSQVEVLTTARDVALRRAADAELAVSATGERLANLRAAVVLWWAAANARPWWRRVGRLPLLPPELGPAAALAPPQG